MKLGDLINPEKYAIEVLETGEIDEVCKMAVRALEKQIPKKVIEEKGETFALSKDGKESYLFRPKCPSCDGNLARIRSFYCPYCGQKLDWSEE